MVKPCYVCGFVGTHIHLRGRQTFGGSFALDIEEHMGMVYVVRRRYYATLDALVRNAARFQSTLPVTRRVGLIGGAA